MILGALETMFLLQDERTGNQCLIVANFQELKESYKVEENPLVLSTPEANPFQECADSNNFINQSVIICSASI